MRFLRKSLIGLFLMAATLALFVFVYVLFVFFVVKNENVCYVLFSGKQETDHPWR